MTRQAERGGESISRLDRVEGLQQRKNKCNTNKISLWDDVVDHV